ncbi:MAG: hydroxyacylglutathione hydrolase [Gammaproteobacteria bacterium]
MINISPIHAFSDNFIWMLRADGSNHVVVVDPGDASPVLAHLDAGALKLSAILITHKHADHVGGIAELLNRFPDIPVFGPRGEPIPHRTQALGEGDRVELGDLGVEFQVMDVPGHTEGHIAYFGEFAADEGSQRVLFCGDTLFASGCGRVFSGTFEQLHESLMRIAALPADTRLYCAHEYTLENIGFAEWVEPESSALAERKAECFALLDAGRDTVPTTVALEREVNPFLRIDEPRVVARLRDKGLPADASAAQAFTLMRRWKDSEYD